MNIFNLSHKNDLDITFSKHLSSNEKVIIKKIKDNNNYLQLDLDYFYKNFSLKNIVEIEEFLKKFSEKYLIINNKNNKYYLPVLSSFYFEDNKIILIFSDYVLNSFQTGTFFNKIGINKILILNEKYSYKLFYLISTSKSSLIEIKIENFKKMFNLSDKYKRFYDMEKNIILPLVNDINNNSDFFISYNKIKASNHRSSKIIALEFYIKLNKSTDENKIINEVMNNIKNKISNFSEIHSLLLKNLSKHGKNYIFKVIDESLKKAPHNFESYLKNTLLQEKMKEIPDKIIEKKVNSLFDLHLEILNILKNHKNIKKINSLNILLKLYYIKEKEPLLFEYEDLKLKIIYNKKEFSRIEIFDNN